MILEMEDFVKIRKNIKGKVVLTSGGYDPIHPGHISCINDSASLGDVMVVVVNGDWFLTNKKGKPFMPLQDRLFIVDSLKHVTFTIPFEIENDSTVIKALEAIKPDIFTKGGDRFDAKTIPEWDTCEKYGIEIVTGMGLPKKWHSSKLVLNAK